MTRSYRGGDDFSDSNTIIAKMSFLILVLILFIVAVGLGIQLISYFLQPRATTYLVYGLQPGTTPKTITQDPSSSESITVWRSNNKNTGIEFTWHVWLNISDVGSSANSVYQHIFNKGEQYPFELSHFLIKKYQHDIVKINYLNYFRKDTNSMRFVGPLYKHIE